MGDLPGISRPPTATDFERVKSYLLRVLLAALMVSVAVNIVFMISVFGLRVQTKDDQRRKAALEADLKSAKMEVQFWRSKKEASLERVQTNYVLLGAATNYILDVDRRFNSIGGPGLTNWRPLAEWYTRGCPDSN